MGPKRQEIASLNRRLFSAERKQTSCAATRSTILSYLQLPYSHVFTPLRTLEPACARQKFILAPSASSDERLEACVPSLHHCPPSSTTFAHATRDLDPLYLPPRAYPRCYVYPSSSAVHQPPPVPSSLYRHPPRLCHPRLRRPVTSSALLSSSPSHLPRPSHTPSLPTHPK